MDNFENQFSLQIDPEPVGRVQNALEGNMVPNKAVVILTGEETLPVLAPIAVREKQSEESGEEHLNGLKRLYGEIKRFQVRMAAAIQYMVYGELMTYYHLTLRNLCRGKAQEADLLNDQETTFEEEDYLKALQGVVGKVQNRVRKSIAMNLPIIAGVASLDMATTFIPGLNSVFPLNLPGFETAVVMPVILRRLRQEVPFFLDLKRFRKKLNEAMAVIEDEEGDLTETGINIENEPLLRGVEKPIEEGKIGEATDQIDNNDGILGNRKFRFEILPTLKALLAYTKEGEGAWARIKKVWGYLRKRKEVRENEGVNVERLMFFMKPR